MSLEDRWKELFKVQVGDSSAWLEVVQENSLFPPDIDPDTCDYTPARGNVFKAFAMLEPNKVKYLVIGQDPYPDESLATGVAFLVPKNQTSESLERLRGTLFPPMEEESNLEQWSEDNGVLLINAALTFPKAGKSGDHLRYWRGFTRAVIRLLKKKRPEIEIIALGQKAANIAVTEALIKFCIHPTKRGVGRDEFKELWGSYGPYRGGKSTGL